MRLGGADFGGRRSGTAYGVLALGTLLTAPAGPALPAEMIPGLYQGTVLVTGQDPENRVPAILRSLGIVLARVSGDPGLEDHTDLAAMLARSPELVESFAYRDRMAGIPVHDEQGSRDRPYDLTVTFDPARIDALLAETGRVPWSGPRPELLVLVKVTFGEARYALSQDGDRGRDLRDALAAAADRYGLPAILPKAADLGAAGADGTGASLPAAVSGLVEAAGADLALVGNLDWDDAAPGWTVSWTIETGGTHHRWGASGVSFDEAFRLGFREAARLLSGS